jgi:Skp family chaperone for outer membrane proteins
MNIFKVTFTLLLGIYSLGTFAAPTADLETISKVGAVNLVKLYKAVGTSDIPKVTKYAKEAAAANQMQVVFGGAAYVLPSVDMTDELIRGAREGAPPSALNFSSIGTRPVIAALNAEKLFANVKLVSQMQAQIKDEFGGDQQHSQSDINKRDLENRKKIAEIANTYISAFALAQGLSIIQHDGVVYADSKSDVTNELILLINEGHPPSAITKTSQVSRISQRIAMIDNKKLFELWSSFPQQSVIVAANLAIAKFAKEKKIDLVFQGGLYVESSIDITDDINKILVQSPPKPTSPAQSGVEGLGAAVF